MATNQAMMAIPFVVDSSNPSLSKGWSEEHINKTQAWYRSLASWARGHVEGEPPKEPPISLLEEWDYMNTKVDTIINAHKVS